MENASKALIIAGAILVAIMIIAFGVNIFNKAQKSVNTEALDSAEIATFNQKWERFAGQQLGSQVKSLISYAISNASTNKDENLKLPSINGASTIEGLTALRNGVTSTATYTVTLHYNSEYGYVDQINF